MNEIEKLIHPHVKNITAYSSARSEYSGNEGIFLDANENPYGDYNRYPDPYQSKLKDEIGRIKNVDSENIFLGNGSDEIIDLLMRIFCRPAEDKIMIFEPTFGLYKISALINNVEVIKIPLNSAFQVDMDEVKPPVNDPALKLIFICSPNNPTGNVINYNLIEYLLESFQGVVVIDEAYIDFSSSKSRISAIADYPKLIVLQTLSKAWAMAGLRIGVAFADPRIMQYLNKVKPPYNISSANQKLALERLRDQEKFQKQIDCIISERERVAEALANCEAVKKIYPSDANFILIEVSNANKIYEQLAEQKIIVRNRHKLIKNSLRITIGRPEENDLLITAFKK